MNEKVLIVDDLPLPPVPPGKVRLTDGRVIDRADCGFTLAEDKTRKTLSAIDGTVYRRDKSGALRRITPKRKRR